MEPLAERVLAGDRLALARLITQVENATPAGMAALDTLFAHTGRAHLIGVTGSPGAGKSSLVNQLVRAYRRPAEGELPRKVGVIAVDPSSPFTGGAILGDRVRMRDATGDPGVFIRSMASRGALGGLARATAAAAQVLDAAGFEVVIIETVGAGQSEVDIARLAHTVLVVEAPGMGDDIQAIKAGILEIADILVVNKADQPAVENTFRALNAMLDLVYAHPEPDRWRPPLLKAVANRGEGIAELVAGIAAHRAFLESGGGWQARDAARLSSELDTLVRARLYERWLAQTDPERLSALAARMARREISPFQALEALVEN